MLVTFNKLLEKWMPLLTPLSLIIGIIIEDFSENYLYLIPWIFAFMTFVGSLSLNLKDLNGVKQYARFIILALIILHIITPLVALALSNLFFDDNLLTIGFLLSVIVPTGVTSFIWVTICKGHGALCLAIILIDTILAPFILPGTLQLLFSKKIEIDTWLIMNNLLVMVFLPSILGLILNEVTKGKVKLTLGRQLAPFSKMSIFIIVLLNGSIIAPYFKNINIELFKIIGCVFIISISGYSISLIIGKLLYKMPQLINTLVFIGGMRNISVGAVIASTYFPARVVMPVVLGMLFQQILASSFSKYLNRTQEVIEKREEYIVNRELY